MSGGRRKRRNLAPGETFILIPRRLLTHKDWISQTPTARAILLDMSVFHNGRNNGAIGYGTRAGAKAANCSPMTAWRALNALGEVALVRLRKRGCFKAHDKQAAEWEIAIFVKKFGPAAPEWASDPLLIPHQILKSATYRAMSNPAKVFLVEAMRRYNGSNNGDIVLGGDDGRWIGLGRNITERAITENASAGFLVETTAKPGRGRSRTWRLTMYNVGRSKATMDFLKVPKRRPEKTLDGITSGDENAVSVSMMVTATEPAFPIEDHGKAATPNENNSLAQKTATFLVTAHDTEMLSAVTAHDTHIEDNPLRGVAGTASLPVAALPPSAPPSRPSRPHRKLPWDELEKTAETANSTEETGFAERDATKARIAGGWR